MVQKELIDKWIKFHIDEKKYSTYYDAWEKLKELISSDPEKAWNIILEIIKNTNNKNVLLHLGAGPLEDLLHEYPDKFINRIEEQIKENNKFRLVFSGVYYDDDEFLPHHIYIRLQKIEKEYKIS